MLHRFSVVCSLNSTRFFCIFQSAKFGSRKNLNMDISVFMPLKNKTVANEVAKLLYNCGCCSKCVLRFMGVKNNSPYSSVSAADKHVDDLCNLDLDPTESVINSEPVSKRRKLSPCSACLGILAELSSSSSISHVVEIINAAGYDSRSFLFSVTIPVCLQIRQLAILMHLKDKFADVYGSKKLEDIPPVKEVYKWSFGPAAEYKLGKFFNLNSPLDITIRMVYADDEKECDLLKGLHLETVKNNLVKRSPKFKWSRAKIEQLLLQSSAESIKSYLLCPPPEPKCSAKYGEITCFHAPIFLAGRYNKYSRQLSQTPWMIDGEKKMESSVQDLIFAQITPNIPSDEIVFSSSGREDVDVRTLGKGRPFLLQLINPHQSIFLPEEIVKLQTAINNSTTEIAVRDLQVVSKEDTARLKEGEEEKIKTYLALCVSPVALSSSKIEILNQMEEITLFQKTPIRVLHRRPIAIRERIIHKMNAEWVDDHHFKLNLTTQAGTYIKEFVHGDFGRTKPNLRELLGCEVDILELDVESIDLDWPPELVCNPE